jgi:hypothetical protein
MWLLSKALFLIQFRAQIAKLSNLMKIILISVYKNACLQILVIKIVVVLLALIIQILISILLFVIL